jgi:hypothetical protein
MNNRMYFLDLITDALKQPDPKPLIVKALFKIDQLGKNPQYRKGFLQFQRFMTEVLKNRETNVNNQYGIYHDNLQSLAFQLATGILKGDQNEIQYILDQIKSNPPLSNEYDELCQEAVKSEAPEKIHIIIDCDGKHFGSVSIEKESQMVSGALPGCYIIRFNTGRILWEGELTEKDLFWAKAFPEQALDLAADTGDVVNVVTRKIKLLDGELVVRVIPKIESGSIKLSIR